MREKIIGILGGMGPEATLLMFAKILENTPAARDQEHLRVIIDNNPKIPERLPAILGVGENPIPLMVESGLSLIRAGADFIVIPCISAHFFLQDLRKQLNIPILSIIDKTVEKVENHHQRLQTVGLLAAEGAIRGGLFREEFFKNGIKTLVPEGDDLKQLMSVIFRIKDTKEGFDRKVIRKEVMAISKQLMQKGAEGIIVGCTEISVITNSKDLPIPFFDALTILARAAIEETGVKAL